MIVTRLIVDKMKNQDIGDIYMNKTHRRKNGNKDETSPVKVAYYAKSMLEKDIDKKEIILVLADRFNKDDLKEFADKYRHCFYIEGIRHIANLIYSIPTKNLDKAMDLFSYNIRIKREILPKECLREKN